MYPISVNLTPDGSKFAISFQYNKQLVDEIKSFEGAKFDKESRIWTVSNTPRNRFTIKYLATGNYPEQYEKALLNFPTAGGRDVWKHQQEMYNHILTRKQCIIAGEMRTGKTLPTLMAYEFSPAPLCWWVSTKSAMEGVGREIKKWEIGKPIYMMTYEQCKKIVGGWKTVTPMFVVFDECHKLKNPNSQISETAMHIRVSMSDLFQGQEYFVLLSGTPAPKDPSDWWHIAELACPGFLKESSPVAMKRRMANMEQREGAVGQAYWHLISWKQDEVDLLYKRLQGLVLVKFKKDCLDLPAIQYELAEVQPTREVMQLAAFITQTSGNALEAINKLRQLSDGFQYDENKIAQYIGSPKEQLLKTDLELHEEVGRIIIYSGFQGSVDTITKVCLENGWNVCQVDGRGWQCFNLPGHKPFTKDDALKCMDRSTDDGSIFPLAFNAQTDSAGTGIELSASPTTVYYSNSNSGAGRMQSEARAHSNNMDKSRGLTVRDYIHLPCDLLIRQSLMDKKDLQTISMGRLKEVMDTYINDPTKKFNLR
jgi:hypothetical protein